MGIATGQGYPDALAGGVLQGKVGSVMLLTRTSSLPDETAQAPEDNKAAIATVTYFGGELAVSQAVRDAVAGALGVVPPDDDPPADGVVTFPDANLEAAVREAISKPTGDITVADMAGLEELGASSGNIGNLTGLEFASNLAEIYLYNNQVSDLSPLAGLTNLHSLWVGGNQISDISPLAANAGLGDGDFVELEGNPLDLTPGSAAMNDIDALEARGVTVTY